MLFSLCYFSAEPSAVEEGFGEGVWHGRDSSLPPVRVNPLPVSQTSSRTGCVRQSSACVLLPLTSQRVMALEINPYLVMNRLDLELLGRFISVN